MKDIAIYIYKNCVDVWCLFAMKGIINAGNVGCMELHAYSNISSEVNG